MTIMSKIGLLFASAWLLGGFANQDDKMDAIKDKKWLLATVRGKAVEYDNPDRPAYVVFSDSSRLSGFTGCNSFFGSYRFTDKGISITPQGMTLMACPPGYSDQPLRAVLMLADQLEVQNGALLLKQGNEVLASFTAEAATATLSGRRWTLRFLKGKAIEGSDAAPHPFLEFSEGPEMVITGNGGCNNFRGAYKLAGQQIDISPMARTRMSCPRLRLENSFMQVLERAEQFEIQGERLTLRSGEEVVAIFQAAGN